MNILVQEQYGFRTNSLTEQAAFTLINSINNNKMLEVYFVTRKKDSTVSIINITRKAINLWS